MFKIDGLLTQLEKDRLLFVSETYHFRHLFIDKNDIIDNMALGFGLTPIFIKVWYVDNKNGYIELVLDDSAHEELTVAVKKDNNVVTIGNKPLSDNSIRIWLKDIPQDMIDYGIVIAIPSDDKKIPIMVLQKSDDSVVA